MLQHFSDHCVCGQINKSAADVRHNQPEPQGGDVCEEVITNHTTDERRRFNRGDPPERRYAAESCPDQKAAERETFGNLVDAQSKEQRPLCSTGRGRFALDSQSQTVCRAMNRQSDDQRGSDFAEMSRGINIEMTGRASRANMMNVFANEKEKRVTGN